MALYGQKNIRMITKTKILFKKYHRIFFKKNGEAGKVHYATFQISTMHGMKTFSGSERQCRDQLYGKSTNERIPPDFYS